MQFAFYVICSNLKFGFNVSLSTILPICVFVQCTRVSKTSLCMNSEDKQTHFQFCQMWCKVYLWGRNIICCSLLCNALSKYETAGYRTNSEV